MMDKVIATIGKNALEQLQIAVKEYQGHTYVDIRLFFLGDNEQWHPTKKGITVSPALWPEFMEAVGQVDKHLPSEDALRGRRRSPRGTPQG
jgi:hypothetical protein